MLGIDGLKGKNVVGMSQIRGVFRNFIEGGD